MTSLGDGLPRMVQNGIAHRGWRRAFSTSLLIVAAGCGTERVIAPETAPDTVAPTDPPALRFVAQCQRPAVWWIHLDHQPIGPPVAPSALWWFPATDSLDLELPEERRYTLDWYELVLDGHGGARFLQHGTADSDEQGHGRITTHCTEHDG